MCDFSLHSVRSRPAQVGDKLVTQSFGTGTRGFAATNDPKVAVCLMPGTELAFATEIAILPYGLLGWNTKTINHRTAIFRQVSKEKVAAHHDALEFPDGRIELLTMLSEGQAATVLQLPAQPTTTKLPRSALPMRADSFSHAYIAAWRSGLFILGFVFRIFFFVVLFGSVLERLAKRKKIAAGLRFH